MYRVKGADQKEYGPISTEQVRQWIQENRLNRFSLAEKEGEPGWKPLGQFPEFGELLPPSPPPTGALPAGATIPPSSHGGGAPMLAASPEQVRRMVSAPAILLLVYGILSVLTSLTGPFFKDEIAETIRNFPNLPPEVAQQLQAAGGAVTVMDWVQAFVMVGLNVVVVLGALKMRQLESWGLALAAAIIAMLPCGCCCCLGLPLGIWAVVVLNKPEVKAGFR